MKVSGIPYIQGRNSYTDTDGQKYGVAIHATANTASARNEALYAQRRTDGVSSHFYADGVETIQSLDTDARAGHAGSSTGNNNAVAVEITGQNAWSRERWIGSTNWQVLGAVLWQVCSHYGIAIRRASVAEMQSNPKVRALYSHDDMRRAWGGTDHTDPGPNFPWDVLLWHVANAAGGPQGAPMSLTSADVEATWNVAQPQFDYDAPPAEWNVAAATPADLKPATGTLGGPRHAIGVIFRRVYVLYRGLATTYALVKDIHAAVVDVPTVPVESTLTEADVQAIADAVYARIQQG